LDEAKLQSYFDGELSIEMMKSVTAHLAACVTCAAAAQELEQESTLLMAALEAELDASVPTERLRERINAAVLGERLATAQATQKRSGLAAIISGLLSFGTQRTLGYASLIVVMAFAVVFGVVTLRTETGPPVETDQEVASIPKKGEVEPATAPVKITPTTTPLPSDTLVKVADTPEPRNSRRRNRPSKTTVSEPEPVRLLPGERAYLQTIARLDTTIKQNRTTMRPSLQAEYERNLAVVDRAIAATRTAAKSNPTNPDAADFMFAAYQSKVDLLNTIADARLSGGPRR
jgi:anti-sigma factor RsiW